MKFIYVIAVTSNTFCFVCVFLKRLWMKVLTTSQGFNPFPRRSLFTNPQRHIENEINITYCKTRITG